MKYLIRPNNGKYAVCYCSQCDYCSIDCSSKCGSYTHHRQLDISKHSIK